jgi:hypothetical protein
MSDDATSLPQNEPVLDGVPVNDWAPRKLTHEQARIEQRLYWSRKSGPERLAAMTALIKRMYKMRGIDLDLRKPNELKTDLTPRFVRRRQS